MFKTVEALDPRKHAELRYRGAPGYGFARGLTHTPLAASEMAEAAKHFPIVFTGTGKLLPVALLSLTPGVTPFVGADGAWGADYVPAHIRRYPFVLGETKEANRFLVMIDRAAPQFETTDGEKLFVDGKAPEGGIVAKARDLLGRLQAELTRTEAMLKPLAESGLLIPRQFNVTRDGKSEVAVRGFRQVDAEALAKLEDSTLAGWVRSGLMAMIVAHLHSLSNASRLLRRHEAEKEAAA